MEAIDSIVCGVVLMLVSYVWALAAIVVSNVASMNVLFIVILCLGLNDIFRAALQLVIHSNEENVHIETTFFDAFI